MKNEVESLSEENSLLKREQEDFIKEQDELKTEKAQLVKEQKQLKKELEKNTAKLRTENSEKSILETEDFELTEKLIVKVRLRCPIFDCLNEKLPSLKRHAKHFVYTRG